MKVEISNLGVIQKAEIDLKPFTVFIGHNNTGKTWTAYTLAYILGQNGFEKYLKAYQNNKINTKYEVLEEAINSFFDVRNLKFNLIDFADEFSEKYINEVSHTAPRWLSEFIDTERVDFNNLEINFSLTKSKEELIERVRKYSIDKTTSFGTQLSLQILKQEDGEDIYFYLVSQSDTGENELPSILNKPIRNIIFNTIIQIIHRCLFSYIYIFPTERTCYIGFPFSIEKISNSKHEKLIENNNDITTKEDIEDKNLENDKHQKIVNHIIDLLKQLNEETEKEELKPAKQQRSAAKSAAVRSLVQIIGSASLKTDTQRQEEVQKNPKILDYIHLANFLEQNILYGYVKFDKSTSQNEIIFQPSKDTNLEIQVASSMVKELAPLVLYLRYLAKPNELLIIDEPEMNLHPAAQVEITEFLAMLVQAGLNVLIATHSPYIVDHLANLMKAAKYEDKDSIKEQFYLEQIEAFIPQEKVSVYLFEEGTAKNILSEQGRIDWATFGNVSDDISHIFQ